MPIKDMITQNFAGNRAYRIRHIQIMIKSMIPNFY